MPRTVRKQTGGGAGTRREREQAWRSGKARGARADQGGAVSASGRGRSGGRDRAAGQGRSGENERARGGRERGARVSGEGSEGASGRGGAGSELGPEAVNVSA